MQVEYFVVKGIYQLHRRKINEKINDSGAHENRKKLCQFIQSHTITGWMYIRKG